MYFCHFLKSLANLNYVNYLENNLNESLKVAEYIKVNINRIYQVSILTSKSSTRNMIFLIENAMVNKKNK